MQMPDLALELIDAEREGWEALASGRGGEHYQTHLAPNAVMAFPFGVMSRQEAINAMEAAPPWSSFDLVGLKSRVVCRQRHCGVSGERAARRRRAYAAIVSSAFVRGDGRWLLAFHQQSPA
jgi:hypothetical protein